MKKLLLFLVFFLPTMVAIAEPVNIEGIYYNLFSKGSFNIAEVTYSPNQYEGNVVIPESVTHNGIDYKVTAINENAFWGCNELLSITIPTTIETIGNDAFYGCQNLEAVHINSIEAWLKIPFINGDLNNPLKWAHHLFLNGEEIKELIIPDGITTIPHYAFVGCSGLTSIIIPPSVTTIENYAFCECKGITSFTIPNSVTTINPGAFSGCSSLSSVVIPNSVTEISEQCFFGCENLRTVTIPNSIKTINPSAFAYCNSLTSIVIPEGVTTICWQSFGYCDKLESISIPKSVTSIQLRAFEYCKSLSDVYCYMPTLSTDMSNRAFENSYIEYATLHVPKRLIQLYSEVEPWKNFGAIVGIIMPKHNIQYIIDGEVYKTITIEEGENITPEEEPIKEGYTFSGWSDIPETMPDHDVTVTGTFTINKYKLVYMVDGSEYKLYDIEYAANITPEAEPTKEGYSFSGWSEIPETMPANDVIVTGTFTINKYKVTYMIDGEVYQTVEVEYGSTITPPNPGDREGYDFAWGDYPSTMPAEDITINGSYTATDIKAILSDESDVKIYNVSGKPLNNLQKGVNILRYKDGRTQKLIIK